MSNELSQKIKELRLKNGMTLEQVGDIVGVGKSTVRKWETGMIANMRRDKIALLAKALGTTPAYLMGWKDDKTNSSEELALSEGEKNLLIFYRGLSDEGKKLFDETIDSFDSLSEEKQKLALQMLHFALGNQ